ncbi:MAG TPA: DUF1702 family protein [Pyrinomonadaceae bacterium]|jgi:hypothetical protein|nr:DUF1702 family protein [Pyrinomonadaceae bacterium]
MKVLADKTLPVPGFAAERPLAKFRRRLFGISPEEVTFKRRGFHDRGLEPTRRLEHVGRTFLRGYHTALSDEGPDALASQLEVVEEDFRGFAYEGAAMGLALLDQLSPWRRERVRAFLGGAGSRHPYMIHVGVGWAIARLPWLRRNVARATRDLDPLLRWLALDGYGFHEGYFHWRRYEARPESFERFGGYAVHAFAQGLGRSLWFVEGADVTRIPSAVASLPRHLHPDIWSGVGLACAYAGGAEAREVERLRAAAEGFKAELAQGAAFAAKTRQRAGNLTGHTEAACQVLCGLSASSAAAVTDETLAQLREDGAVPAYEVWRQRIQSHFI